MRLQRFAIANFGSISEIEFTDLGRQTVLIGPNGSGKSFIMQALNLFFREFSSLGGGSALQNAQYVWHQRNVGRPIRVYANLALDDAEVDAVSAEFHPKSTAEERSAFLNTLSVRRELLFGEGWRTQDMHLGDLLLVQDNDWAVAPVSLDTDPAILDRIVQDAFAYISPPAPSQETEGRPAGIAYNVLNEMRAASLSNSVIDENRWSLFTGAVEGLLGWRLDPNPAEPLVQLGTFRVPQRQLGVGEQRVTELLWQIHGQSSIVALEEPELHLHPGLARRLADSLTEIAPNSQFLLSTHSINMVDKADITNNWVLKQEEGATSCGRIATVDEFRSMLHGLGVVPSDILAKDFVLFVEGGTEAESIVPRWAETLGLELDGSFKVGVLSIGGGNRLKDNLRIWLGVMSQAPAEFHVMVDSGFAGEVVRVSKDLDIDQRRFTVLTERCIEDYYPPDLIVEALSAVYKIEDISTQKVSQKPRDRSIERVVQQAGLAEHRWKIPLAAYVGARMTENQIPDEFKAIVDLIKAIVEPS